MTRARKQAAQSYPERADRGTGMNVLTTLYMRLEAEALMKEGNEETADTLEQAADIIDRLKDDNQRLRDYIDLCAEKFGMEMPNDSTDTGLFAALHPEGDGE